MDRALIPVTRDGRWGYIDRAGAIAIPPSFSFAGEFRGGAGEVRGGLARVCEGGGTSQSGEVIGGSWGFIDSSGEYISDLRFSEALDFEDSFAPVCVGSAPKYIPYDSDYYMEGGAWGFIDARGQWAMEPGLEYTRGFRDGLAPAKQAGRHGYLDHNFQWVIEREFQLAYQFSEGVAGVWLFDKRWTYIDKQGVRLMEPRFELAYPFSEGLAAGLEREPYRYVFMNHSFKDVFSTPAGVTHVGEFSEGLVWAIFSTLRRMNDGKLYPMAARNGYGYLNRKGEWAIPPQFDTATNFSESLACVKDDKGEFGYIRADGSWAIPARFSAAEPFSGGLARVRVGSSCSVIDPQGTAIWSEAG